MKDRVYRHELGPVVDLPDLMERIVKEFHWIRDNAMSQVCRAVDAFHGRLQLCLDNGGCQLGLLHC